ncbi:MAG: AEC family transporter [Butyrivibrio sp.]|nr:AEC family transporter [Muribaculum sp.]MCM1553121.1 AEC family transporter [Butyrivibrio sp.]
MKMSDILIFAINAVMPIIIMIGLGYYLKQKGLFTEEFLKIGNKTVFKLLLPILLFTNLTQMDSFAELELNAIVYVTAAIAILFIVGLVISTRTSDPRQKGVLLQCVFRSNFALIGVPLAQLIAGEQGVQAAAVLSAFTIPLFNILAVIALSLYAADTQTIKPAQRICKILKDILHNPLIIGVLAGILVVCLKPVIPLLPHGLTGFISRFGFVQTVLDYLAKASTPVALLILGGQFEFSRVQSLKRQIILGTTGRLLFAPLLGIGGAVLLHVNHILTFDRGTCAAFIALFGTPVAVASAVMAEEMGSDGQLAGQLVVWTTLLSSVVIFVSIVLLRGIGLL